MSTWTSLKPLTLSSRNSPGDTAFSWLGQMSSYLVKKLSVVQSLESVGEWNYIQLVATQQWGSPGLSVGASPIYIFINNLDEGLTEFPLSQFVDDSKSGGRVDCWKAGRFCRGIWTGWIDGLRPTV